MLEYIKNKKLEKQVRAPSHFYTLRFYTVCTSSFLSILENKRGKKRREAEERTGKEAAEGRGEEETQRRGETKAEGGRKAEKAL